ncbi:MAG: sigma factor [Lapillicoccus sp.]
MSSRPPPLHAVGARSPAAYAARREADARLVTELAQCARGDIEAFGRVYDATVGRLFALALVVTRAPDEAELLLRRTYLSAWRTVCDFDPQRSSAAAWLATILREAAVDPTRASTPRRSGSTGA